LHVSAPSLSRHNSSTDLPSELLAQLVSAPLVWVHRGGFIPPLQPLYDGPYAVLRHCHRSFTIRVGLRDEWSPSDALRPAQQRMPRLAARHATPWQTAGLAPRRSCRNQAGLVFRPAGFFTFFLSRRQEMVPEPFSYPPRRFLHAREQRHFHSLHKRGIRPVNGHRPRG
jgi:hypothetical protein